MKKIILNLIIGILLMGMFLPNGYAETSPELDNLILGGDNVIEDLGKTNPLLLFFQDAFTVFPTVSQLKIGESTRVFVTERAVRNCNTAELILRVTNPNGQTRTYSLTTKTVGIDGRVDWNINLYPDQTGTWNLLSRLYCRDTGQYIETPFGGSTNSFTVTSSTISGCTQDGPRFCETTSGGSRVLQDKCENGFLDRSVTVQDCSSQGSVCVSGQCVNQCTKDEVKTCFDGSTIITKECTNGELKVTDNICPEPKETLPSGTVCCKQALGGYSEKLESECGGFGQIVEDSFCTEDNGSGGGAISSGKTKAILESQLDNLAEEELEDSACDRTSDCEEGAVCIPFDNLPKKTQERLGGGLFNLPEDGVCVIPEEVEGFDICSLALIDITGDCQTDAIILIVGSMVILLIFMKIGGK